MKAQDILALPIGKHKITDGNFINTLEVKKSDNGEDLLYFVRPEDKGDCILLTPYSSGIIRGCAGGCGVNVHGDVDMSYFRLTRSYVKKDTHC